MAGEKKTCKQASKDKDKGQGKDGDDAAEQDADESLSRTRDAAAHGRGVVKKEDKTRERAYDVGCCTAVSQLQMARGVGNERVATGTGRGTGN